MGRGFEQIFFQRGHKQSTGTQKVIVITHQYGAVIQQHSEISPYTYQNKCDQKEKNYHMISFIHRLQNKTHQHRDRKGRAVVGCEMGEGCQVGRP